MDFTPRYKEIIANLNVLELHKRKANTEVNIAIEYKEDLCNKMVHADKEISVKQMQLQVVLQQIQDNLAKLKIEFDLYVNKSSSVN